MTRKKFNALSDVKQWQWVIDNKKDILLIEIDNDCTYVSSPLFKEEGNEECTGSISMKSYLGNGWGIYHLMTALEIKCSGV